MEHAQTVCGMGGEDIDILPVNLDHAFAEVRNAVVLPQTVTSTGKGVAPAAAAASMIPVHHPEHNEAPNEVLNVHRGAAGDGETG